MGLHVTFTTIENNKKTVSTLADSDEEIATANLQINGARLVQIVDLVRGENAQHYGRMNRRKIISFETTRLHNSIQEAATFALDHEDSCGWQGTLMIQITDENGGSVVRYMSDAVIDTIDLIALRGCTTRWRYIIRGATFGKAKQ